MNMTILSRLSSATVISRAVGIAFALTLAPGVVGAQAPGAPTGVTSTVGVGLIGLSWTAPAGAPVPTSYDLCAVKDTDFVSLDASCIGDATFNASGTITRAEQGGPLEAGQMHRLSFTTTTGSAEQGILEINVPYRVAVRAVVGTGAAAVASPWTAGASTAIPRPPAAPIAPRAVAGDGRIFVSWTAPVGNFAPNTYQICLVSNVGGSIAFATHINDLNCLESQTGPTSFTSDTFDVRSATNDVSYAVGVRAEHDLNIVPRASTWVATEPEILTPMANVRVVGIEAANSPVTEDVGASVSFTITIADVPDTITNPNSNPQTALAGGLPVTVTLTGADNFVASGDRTQTVTIAEGARTATVNFPITDDNAAEPDATVTATIDTSAAHLIDPANPAATAMVVDGDDDTPLVSIATTTSPVTEAYGATVSFTITSTIAPLTTGLDVSVTLTGADDFVALVDRTQTVTIAVAETTATVNFPITSDTVSEDDATVTATIGNSAAYIGDGATATAVVLDDDDPPTLTIAAANSPVTEAAGAEVSFTITSTSPAPRGGLNVSVTLTGANRFVAPAERTQIVTIAAAATTATVNFPITDDGVTEPAATVTATIGNSGAYEGDGNTATAVVLDDDVPTITIAAVKATFTEGTDDNVSFTVRSTLAATAGGIVVSVTLTGADDFVAPDQRTQIVTIAAAATTATVNFPITDDGVTEPAATVTATIGNSGAYEGDGNTATAVVLDDDVPTLTIAAVKATFTEGTDDNVSFTVTASSAAPRGGLNVSMTLTGADDFVAPAERTQTVTIAVDETTATVNFPITNDDEDEEDATVTATIGNSAAYEGDGNTATAVVLDDDVPTLTIAAVNSPVTEAEDATVSFTVTSGSAALRGGLNVSVTLTGADDFVAPADRTQTGTIAAGTTETTVNFPITNDDEDEEDATVTATIDNSAAYEGDGATATAEVLDDDESDDDTAALKVILPEMARAMADSAVNAIKRRLAQSSRDITGQATLGGVAFGHQSAAPGHRSLTDSVGDLVAAHGPALANGAGDVTSLLANSGFVLPLAEGGGANTWDKAVLWGRGAHRNLSGDHNEIDWDGTLTGMHLGADMPLREDLLAGVSVSWLQGAVNNNTSGSEYDLDMLSAHPYLGWRAGLLDAWATAGYGAGTLETRSTESAPASSDISMTTFAFGGGGDFGTLGEYGDFRLMRDVALRLNGEFLVTAMEMDGAAGLSALSVNAQRLRVTLEAAGPRQTLADGGSWQPSVEVGLRGDTGDGATGAGAEIGGGLIYTKARFTADGRIRGLVGHSGGYQEWGINGGLRLQPDPRGQGLSFTISPAYGADAASTVQQVWQQDLPAAFAAASGSPDGRAVTTPRRRPAGHPRRLRPPPAGERRPADPVQRDDPGRRRPLRRRPELEAGRRPEPDPFRRTPPPPRPIPHRQHPHPGRPEFLTQGQVATGPHSPPSAIPATIGAIPHRTRG